MPHRVDLFVAAVVLMFSSVSLQAQESASVDFARDVQPLLQQHCVSCHGPARRMAGLRLDRRRDALRGGTLGAVIGPGNGDASRLYIRISSALADDPQAAALKGSGGSTPSLRCRRLATGAACSGSWIAAPRRLRTAARGL